MTRTYTVLFEREDDGGFSVWTPDLPGCASQGETLEEARANIREAVTLYVDTLRAKGLPVPEPHTQVEPLQIDAAA